MLDVAMLLRSAVLILLVARLGSAQAAATSPTGARDYVKSFGADEWQMWTSPFRASSYSTRAVKKYVIPFAIISAAMIASDRETTNALPNTNDQRIWSGRVSQLGAPYTLAGFSAAVFTIGQMTGDRHARETGLLALEAVAHSQLVVFGIKQITNRRRPIEEEARARFWTGGNSFVSGHAATSFAVAAVFSYEYRDHIAVPIIAYSTATLISASRVSGRRHWVSDIFAGGSAGFLIGRYVYRRRHDPNLPGSPVRRGSLVPDVGVTPSGAMLAWRW